MNNKLRIVLSLVLFFQISSCGQKENKIKIMDTTNHKFTNKLINEKSPYLLQHAHNPVNWFPWGEEAFELAKKLDKPIFLSIGYSTCHWCHVMEHESFEDEEVAKLMNESFISIKVDREERPDIDNIYMSVCQMLTGHGGWPMTIIMTPDKKPFFAGTYFPKYSKGNRIGLIDLIDKINSAWKNQRDEINNSAEQITFHLTSSETTSSKDAINLSILEQAYSNLESRFDEKNGGFGEKPKFPSPHNYLFLLNHYYKTKNDHALNMVTKSLTQMRLGGVYDQIGYGFHRYSTDQKWFLPHFEKMLYDQAMLLIAYSGTYQATKNQLFKKTADEIITYVLRDMTSPEGGFYSAEDADSEGEEGKFYVWEKKEILNLLGKEDGELYCQTFNITDKGNYFEEASGKPTGTNIPHLSDILFDNKIDSLRTKLFNEREKRVHPYKDDKILTDWNGIMIAALAKAGRIFNNAKYIESAEKAVAFIESNLTSNEGSLLHRYRDGDAAIDAQIDDYSFIIWGLLELYETTFKVSYLKKAINYTQLLFNDFWDNTNYGFYFTNEQNTDLIARPKEFYDGAIPSGNSVMYLNLLRLAKLTANTDYDNYADKLTKAFKQKSEQSPAAFTQFLSGLHFADGNSYEILITGKLEDEKTKEIIDAIEENFIPNKVILVINETNKFELNELAPFTKDYETSDDETTVYVCKNYVCNLPTISKAKVLELLTLK